MFYVYKITSFETGKCYVGMSKNPRTRLYQHKSKHPKWFLSGGRIEILSRHRSVATALHGEARAIIAHNTLAPNGLNKVTSGAVGLLRDNLMPADIKRLAPKMSQAAKDAVALGRLAKQPRMAVDWRTQQHRRRTAWKRRDAGLPPLPGTEHLLVGPKTLPRKAMPKNWHENLSKGRRRWLAKHPVNDPARKCLANWKGKKRSEQDKENKKKAAARRAVIHGPTLTWPMILRKAQLATKRAAEGKQPVPGTEIFLGIKQPKGRADADWIKNGAQYRKDTVQAVNAWLRQYGIDQGWIKP